MGWWRSGLVILAGCGRLGFEAVPGEDEDVDVEPFGLAQPLTELNTQSEDDDPSPTADELEIYFSSSRGGIDQIWHATRASRNDRWSAPEVVTALDVADADESHPAVTADGLTIVITVDGADTAQNDLWISTREDRTAPWATPRPIAELASAADDEDAFVGPGALWIYFGSDRGGDNDIYFARRAAATQPFGPAVRVEPVAASGSLDSGPWADARDSVIWFTSSRGGTLDIYSAARDATGRFAVPGPIAELDDGGDEEDPWLSPDQRTLYYASDRDGSSDLMVASRDDP